MSKPMFLAMIVAGALLGVLSAGCGGASGSSDPVVAQVGRASITESTLNHRVAAFVRSDFYAVNVSKAPPGLATDPPDYASCVRAAKTLAPPASSGKRIFTAAQLERRCHSLYTYVRQEALSDLIYGLWAVGQDAEIGKHVSDQAVQQDLGELVKKHYKTQQAFATYLANAGWSLADMHYNVKRSLLAQQLAADSEAKARKLGGGEQALVKVILQRNVKWTNKTNCRAGYVVSQCKEYKATPASTTPIESSPAVIFEEMNGGRYVQASSR